ncbi:MAG: hypothetical protein OEU49_03690 [Chromatiales bacterium]|jgi:hypothetical protein|nr:hypothetical protein [Chromatiales bacterium]
MIANLPGPGGQRGFILVLALVFLSLITLSATMAPRFAALEIGRAEAMTMRSVAGTAASMALTSVLQGTDIISTVPTVLLHKTTADSSSLVRSRFLGIRLSARGDPSAGLVEWHFLLTAEADAGRGAHVTHRQQIFILAPAPVDPAECSASGCPVPPVCGESDGCVPDLRAPAQPVSWHLPEEDT